jgi:hypothetical protein
MRGRTLILDLDQCLLQSFTDPRDADLEKALLTNPSYMSLRDRMYHVELHDYNVPKGTGTVLHMWGVTRPHFKEFLLFARSYFDVICVWSAATKDYVNSIVEQIFHDIRVPDLVYTRDDVESFANGEYHKPIAKILADPRIKDRVDIKRTFFLDDKGDNFITSPGNGITIPEYKPAPRISNMMSDDIALLQLRQWLLKPEIANAPDIRLVSKVSIFITPLANEKDVAPLAENRDPWSMYSNLNSPSPDIVASA